MDTLKLLLRSVILIAFSVTAAYAFDAGQPFTVSLTGINGSPTIIANPGDEFQIEARVSSVTRGLFGFSSKFGFDPNVIEMVTQFGQPIIERVPALPGNPSPAGGIVAGTTDTLSMGVVASDGVGDSPVGGTILRITFRVKSTANPGDSSPLNLVNAIVSVDTLLDFGPFAGIDIPADTLISGFVQLPGGTGDIDVFPLAIDFGTVVVGALQEDVLVISNTGNATLVLGTLSKTGPNPTAFTFAPILADVSGSSIAPGDSISVAAKFSPGVAGPKSATLVIPSNDPDPDEDTVFVALAGMSVVPPNIVVTPTFVDFGTVDVGVQKSDTLTVSNTGGDTLKIFQVSIPLPPFNAFPIGPLNVLPGGLTQIVVQFQPPSAGAFIDTLKITSNDPDTPSLGVPLTGEGVVPPPSASRFGEPFRVSLTGIDGSSTIVANPGEEFQIEARVSSVTRGLFGFSSKFGFDPNVIELVTQFGQPIIQRVPLLPGNPTPAGGLVAGTNDTLSMGVVASDGVGDSPVSGPILRITFRVKSTASPGGSSPLNLVNAVVSVDTLLEFGPFLGIDIPADTLISGLIQVAVPDTSDIAVSPERIDYGIVLVGGSSDSAITIKNFGSKNLVLGDLSLTGADAGEFSIAIPPSTSISPGDISGAVIRFSPQSGGTKSATLVIPSNDPDESSVNVPLTGTGFVLEPDIAVVPDTLVIRGIIVGSTRLLNVTVSNVGNADLYVTGISLTGAVQFSRTDGVISPFTLAPGSDTTLTVQFAPDSVGSFDGTLTITSNDPDKPSVDVPLTGAGIALSALQVSIPHITASPGELISFRLSSGVLTSIDTAKVAMATPV